MGCRASKEVSEQDVTLSQPSEQEANAHAHEQELETCERELAKQEMRAAKARWEAEFPSITIDGFIEASGHTEYEIVSQLAGQRYPSQHRVADFRRLHRTIQSQLRMQGDFPVPEQSRTWREMPDLCVPRLQAYLRAAVESAQARGGVPDALSRFLHLPQEFALAHEETLQELEKQALQKWGACPKGGAHDYVFDPGPMGRSSDDAPICTKCGDRTTLSVLLQGIT